MWIVRVALNRPYTFVVLALLILLVSPLVILRTPTDIFPNIGIPVVSVIWNYDGFPPQEMSDRIVTITERSITTTVNDIEHMESQSYNGIGVIKLFFRPSVTIATALAQVTAICQSQLRQLPPGTTAPLILSYSASTVPVLQIGLSSTRLSEQQLFDLGANTMRTQLATVQGAAVPWPYGGKMRLVSIDIDSAAMQAKGLSPTDVVNAVSAENLILPSGTAKLGPLEYQVEMNGSTQTINELNDLPVKTVNGATTYIRDVAHVRDGFSPQTNIVRQDGHRSALLSVYKTGSASTLAIVHDVRAALSNMAAGLPPELKITPLFDQSIFVRAAVQGVIREALTSACLTAAMILLFLGNWRSTLIIAISIPLAILVSIICLSALGETMNLMTLGGLALAVGILVDDATVEIENIERNRLLGKELREAILHGAQEIAVPAFVSTLCICIVFVPMFFLSGVTRFLFVPLAEAVIFAMLASYLLSRTLVPTMVMYLLRNHNLHAQPGFFGRFHQRFESAFDRLRDSYRNALEACMRHGRAFTAAFLALCVASLGFVFVLGQDLFPQVDAGLMRLHVRARTGLRIEETARLTDEIENDIRTMIPVGELDTMLDNIGLPYSGINLSYSNAGTIGTPDAEILISLKEGHRPTTEYVKQLREELPRRFPSTQFFFQPADIVTQILNFGVPAPIDVQIAGSDQLGLWPLGVVLVFELLSGFLAIECPIDRDAISVGSPVPGAGFRPENPDLAESALPQTLLGKEADLQFRLIQPTSVYRRVVNGEPIPQRPTLFLAEAVRQRLLGVGTQVVHDQMDGLRRGIAVGDGLDEVCKFQRRPGRGDLRKVNSCLRFDAAEYIGSSSTFVFIVALGHAARFYGQGFSDIVVKSHRLFIYAHHRLFGRQRPFIDFQHIFHRLDVFVIELGDAPHFFPATAEGRVLATRSELSRVLPWGPVCV